MLKWLNPESLQQNLYADSPASPEQVHSIRQPVYLASLPPPRAERTPPSFRGT